MHISPQKEKIQFSSYAILVFALLSCYKLSGPHLLPGHSSAPPSPHSLTESLVAVSAWLSRW